MRHTFRLAVPLILVLGLCACKETPESTYTSRQAAEQAGAFSRGWLPAFLPSSASDLRELHNLDSNESLLRFSFMPADLPTITASLQPVSESELCPPPFQGLRRPAWWPKDLVGAQRGGLRFFRSTAALAGPQTPAGWFAVDAARGIGFFWRCSS